MYETPGDVSRLQRLLDESHAAMGEHMRSILTPDRRLPAADVVAALQGMTLLSLATVNRLGEPRVGPVDGLFYRGRFWFGSSPDAARFRHIRARPSVSATRLDGERFAVTVHGTAVPVDATQEGMAGFRNLLIEIYGERWWRDVGVPAQFAVIEPNRMYTYFTGSSVSD